ncbi:ATP-dependent metallopeptidase Hfl [Sporormia fimetaria CBS 119925]|uniref:ATP-dependent metallopeptidase Hfl n=1 Tax=Sporormia fimetaria CBS 119925 TaxID=1340428 RepID=A0A6A6VGX5_9PLEO|nr:ATP-dependent metallopeptidase Hfl [Sporormia fimetaria CBS 119925]
MSFQVSASLQNIASTTMSTALRAPVRRFARTQSVRSTTASAAPLTRTLAAAPYNALRAAAPMARSTSPNTLASRPYSTTSRTTPFAHLRPLPRAGNVGLSLIQQRTIIFGTPSQKTLARLELAANNNPTNIANQTAFYDALLRANMHQIIIDRYRSGRFTTDDNIDSIYQQALNRTGQSDGAAYNGQGTPHQLSQQHLQAIGQAVGTQTGGGFIGKARAGTGLKNDPVYVVVEESLWASIFKWVRWLAGFALAGYVALVFISLFVESTGVLKKVGGGGDKEVRAEQQSARFSDVHGCDEAKEELEDILDFLKHPERYSKLGGRLPKGVLLVGPPGTGKTLLARAVAGEAGVPFFYMSGSEFDEVYVGVGAKRVRELFTAARAKAPAIVFIDELDAIGGKRQSRDANYHRQTLNQLLNDLDGFDQSTGVIFIAATNHPELLDKALLRPGRFDRHVQVELPDMRGRLAILKHHTKKIRLAPNIDLIKLAQGTPGCSGAELENIANSAAIRASKKMAKFVTVDDLEWAKDKILMGAERKSRKVSMADKVHTAYHEGGHTLILLYTKGYNELHKATILPRGNAAGITFFLPPERGHKTRAEYNIELQVCMGGKMAEELVYGPENVSAGPVGDIQHATAQAYDMVTRCGFSDKVGDLDLASKYDELSDKTKDVVDKEVRKLIDQAKEEARRILIEKRDELDTLAKALVVYETLDKEEIMKVIKGEKLDRLVAAPEESIKLPERLPLPKVRLPLPPSSGGSSDPPTGHGIPA